MAALLPTREDMRNANARRVARAPGRHQDIVVPTESQARGAALTRCPPQLAPFGIVKTATRCTHRDMAGGAGMA